MSGALTAAQMPGAFPGRGKKGGRHKEDVGSTRKSVTWQVCNLPPGNVHPKVPNSWPRVSKGLHGSARVSRMD